MKASKMLTSWKGMLCVMELRLGMASESKEDGDASEGDRAETECIKVMFREVL